MSVNFSLTFFSYVCLKQHADSKTSERKRPKDDVVNNIKKSDEPPVKKRRTTTDKQIAKAKKSEPAAGEAAVPKVKPANPLGALIGRKRKERKSGKKGGK
jgi:nucleolar protein 4